MGQRQLTKELRGQFNPAIQNKIKEYKYYMDLF